mmetsp:Transcript_14713/g.24507  ORF Transcript_14713/g.24507 Transcript_14713/m.24507 type:complete len:446 (+) Transcript_14713:105-1442(+)|eukprot:CAMPEP_0119319052 /NCGR_PEP_ID=MMETSP1333-20130426/48350_1 /TAXON_ID=418940 /ORGANISM="Scyphosphaera apsteinii, Strain RCC1455" /LENGTH=445 /DNA_ID=CAMNT_0007325375 /DNA_START=105 /DNA_END=1442 /DNA_ORIENTATION=-
MNYTILRTGDRIGTTKLRQVADASREPHVWIKSGYCVKNGETVTAIHKDASFTWVRCANGEEGFVRTAYLCNSTIASGPAFRCGLLADLQYADCDNVNGRHYRDTLKVLDRAVDFFNQYAPLAFVAHVGDLVDIRNTFRDSGRASRLALRAVMEGGNGLRGLCAMRTDKLVCLIGNHELYNFPRTGVDRQEQPKPTPLAAPPFADDNNCTYYSFVPAAGWRIVVVDSFIECACADGRFTEKAKANDAKRRYEAAKEAAKPNALPPEARRFYDEAKNAYDMNGALGEKQLEWLQDTLRHSMSVGERVLILSHALFMHASEDQCYNLAWDYDSVLELLASDDGKCVVACLHGHAHAGSVLTDARGVHHIVLETPMFCREADGEGQGECGPFVVLEAHATHLVLKGYGNRRGHPKSRSPLFGDKPNGLSDPPGELVLPLVVQGVSSEG